MWSEAARNADVVKEVKIMGLRIGILIQVAGSRGRRAATACLRDSVTSVTRQGKALHLRFTPGDMGLIAHRIDCLSLCHEPDRRAGKWAVVGMRRDIRWSEM